MEHYASNEPHNLVTQAADKGLEATVKYMAKQGVDPVSVVVLVYANMEGEQHAGVGGYKLTSSRALLTEVLTHAKGIADCAGMQLAIFDTPGGQG